MCALGFTRDTLLDLTVNVVPLGIILFFIVLFLVVTPWGWDPFPVLVSHGLLVIPFVSLALLTYVAGRVIQRDEARG